MLNLCGVLSFSLTSNCHQNAIIVTSFLTSQPPPNKRKILSLHTNRISRRSCIEYAFEENGKNTGPKTYNSGDSPVVTHLTTSPPVEGLTCGEQTGSGVCPSPVVVCGRKHENYRNQCWCCDTSDFEHVRK
jgi:hypothetical protein